MSNSSAVSPLPTLTPSLELEVPAPTPVAAPVGQPVARATDRLDVMTSIPFFAMHAAAIAGLFYFPVTWKGVALCAGFYFLRMFGITAGFHRYFSHRSYKMGRVMQFLMALLGTLSVQKGVLWWASNHRHHHRFSDKPEDIHSPIQRGFIWSHVGWILSTSYDETGFDRIKDFAKYPELVWLNKYHLVPITLFGALLVAAGGWSAFYWGFVLSTVILWHGTYTVNSLTHLFGRKRFPSGDDSRNSMLIALITMGEGWHNNHHFYQSSTRQGFYWWEIDMSFYGLKLLEKLHLVHDLRGPPEHILAQGRQAR